MSHCKSATLGLILLCATGPASADKNFAHSKSLNMSFIAEGDPWCRPDVDMRVEAGDAAKFGTADYTEIIQKLGHVLVRECPEAQTLKIAGEVSGQPVWQGTAARSDGWLASETPAPGAVAELPAAQATEVPEPAPAVAVTGLGESAAMDKATEMSEAVAEAEAAHAARAAAEAAEAAEVAKAAQAAEAAKQAQAAEAAKQAQAAEAAKQAQAAEAARQAQAAEAAKQAQAAEAAAKAAEAAQAAQAAAVADAKPAAGVHFPKDCKTLFEWGAAAYEVDKNARTVGFAGGRYQGKALMTGLKDENLVPVYGEPIDKWTDADLGNWVVEFERCDQELKQATRGIRNRYSDPLYKLYAGGSAYFNNIMQMRRRGNDDYAYPNMIRHQVVVYQEQKKAVELQASQLEEVARLDATAENIQKVSVMASDPLLLYLSPKERQTHQMMLNNHVAALKEKLRIEQQRAQYQAQVDQQFQQLVAASPYDKVRFYTTLVLEPGKMDAGRVDPAARVYYNRGASPFAYAVQLTHPAQYFNRVQGDRADIGGAMYMLVVADDGRIDKPYRMQVDGNETSEAIDGWMLLKTGPGFNVRYGDDGKPVFGITVEAATACRSERCLNEMDPVAMMKTWYGDEDLQLAEAATSGGATQ